MAGTLVLDTLQNGAGTASTSADNVINGCAKAWVNFNGVTGAVGIRASYNVSSVTRNSTGDWTISFTNAFADANYAACLGANGFSTTDNGGPAILITGSGDYINAPSIMTTTQLRVHYGRVSSGNFDANVVCVSVFR